MLLARNCHIATAEFGLIPLKSGELSYITRRMDRDSDKKLHMEDFCQILNKVTAQKYNGSMEQIGRALREYSDVAGLDAIRLFELTVFCFLTGNSDMHLKNFSLLRRENGTVELSPAYDLVPVNIILPEDKEELARREVAVSEQEAKPVKKAPVKTTKTTRKKWYHTYK